MFFYESSFLWTVMILYEFSFLWTVVPLWIFLFMNNKVPLSNKYDEMHPAELTFQFRSEKWGTNVFQNVHYPHCFPSSREVSEGVNNFEHRTPSHFNGLRVDRSRKELTKNENRRNKTLKGNMQMKNNRQQRRAFFA